MKHLYKKSVCLLLAALMLLPSVFAGELDPREVYCFQPGELAPLDADGVLITAVPDQGLGQVKLGNRTICAGDVLTGDSLSSLRFVPTGTQSGQSSISCLSLTPEGLGENTEMTLKIGSVTNEPPSTADSEFETYKNIPGQVRLKAVDPEGGPLSVTIVKEPKRGTLEISTEGEVTYTPEKNKVGKDSFTYTVTDDAGNVSPEATVRITIRKPSDKETYADMAGDKGLLAATWLREMGIYSGETVSGHMLFQPEEPVTRGDFIAMCMGLTGSDVEGDALSTGFADEADTPAWLRGYVAQAVKCGYISGVPTGDGLKLLAYEPISRGEAAVIVANLLELPTGDTQSVMAQFDTVPAWAASAVSAAMDAGIFDATDSQMVLTRRDAACLIYDTWHRASESSGSNSLLAWAMR